MTLLTLGFARYASRGVSSARSCSSKMPATPADAAPRVRFRLQQSADGRTCVDVVECFASRRLLVDKHAVVADPRAKDVAAAALHELDVLLSLQQLQDDASGQHRHLRDHVVRLEGYRLEGERLHVLQEFCARGDLQRTVEREARLVRAGLLNAEDGRTTSVRGVRTLFRQLLRGVAALHAAGVAHLDLSLENVLLTDAEVVKVADLGHAVRIANASQCITPAKDAYAAPELLAPQTQQVDVTKCDSWALGVILYALCAKRALVSCADGSDAFFAEMCKIGARRALRRRFVREAESPAPCSLFAAPEQLPSGLFDLMSRLLDVDPNSRMSPATALQHPWLSNVITRRVSAASLPERATQPIFRRASSMNSSTSIPTNHGRQTTVSKTVSINSIQSRHTTTPKSSVIATQSRPSTIVRSSSVGSHQGRQPTTKKLSEPVHGNRMELKMESGSPERSSSRRRLRNEIVLDETRVAMLRPSAS